MLCRGVGNALRGNPEIANHRVLKPERMPARLDFLGISMVNSVSISSEYVETDFGGFSVNRFNFSNEADEMTFTHLYGISND